MSRAFIMTVNNSTQNVQANGIISLGNVARMFGCNLRLNGDSVNAKGEGYYQFTANVVLAPAAEGAVTVTLYDNGVQIPGAFATTTVAAANDVVTLNVPTAIRVKCGCCEGEHNITCRVSVESSVTNIVLVGDKK